jgi:hypothetical protein
MFGVVEHEGDNIEVEEHCVVGRDELPILVHRAPRFGELTLGAKAVVGQNARRERANSRSDVLRRGVALERTGRLLSGEHKRRTEPLSLVATDGERHLA